MSNKRDYYEVLGVAKEATSDEIRKAYKREALKHHPDRNPGDSAAEGRFKEASEAFQVLSDEQKRSIYDRFGHRGLEGGSYPGAGADSGDIFGQMQDLFNEMFSGGGFSGGGGRRTRRGQDIRVEQRITLQEAAFGCKRDIQLRTPVRCDDCTGTGAEKGSKAETCPQCRGTGSVQSARGFVMFSGPCNRCEGTGRIIKNPCKGCRGEGFVERPRKVTVSFPAGIDNGQRLRVGAQGMPAPSGGEPGDLYVDVEVADDSRFERDGFDLHTQVHVTFVQAALGGEVQVPCLVDGEEDAKTTVQIPAGTQPGDRVILRGQGVPRVDGRGRGAPAVHVVVDVPKKLSDKAKKLLKEFEAEFPAGDG